MTVDQKAALPELRQTYLREVLDVLWPGRHGTGPGGSGTGEVELLVLPNLQRPSLVLPRSPRAATASGLRCYNVSARGTAALRFHALAAAAACGAGALWPHRVAVPAGLPAGAPDTSFEAYLTDIFGPGLSIGVYVGPTRANRKPVVQVFDRTGAPVGLAKLGVNGLTNRLVAHEAETLRLIGACSLRHVRVPALLHQGEWRGRQVLIQEYLPSPGRRGDTADIVAAHAEIAAVDGTTRARAVESAYWSRLDADLHRLGDGDAADPFVTASARLRPQVSDAVLRFGAWHGDWAPWNMAVSKRQVLLWDWERFQTDVPLGFDALHHRLQSAGQRREEPATRSLQRLLQESPQTLAPFGASASEARLTAGLYLLHLATRYLGDAADGSQGQLGQAGLRFLPALREVVSTMEPW